MDPNAALAQLRELAATAGGLADGDPLDVAQTLTSFAAALEDLDRWLSAGGFLPAAWAR